MMAYLKHAERNKEILAEKIKTPALINYEEQNFQSNIKLESEKEYTTIDLIERMIKYSDNNAYDLLLNHFPDDELMRIYNDLGVNISRANSDPAGNILTIRDYASFFRILYNATYLNPEMSEKALRILSGIDFKYGIKRGIPSDVITSHKFGERYYLETGEKQLHDCGIVYKIQGPYLLCIMTRGKDFNNLSKIIGEISKITYDFTDPKN